MSRVFPQVARPQESPSDTNDEKDSTLEKIDVREEVKRVPSPGAPSEDDRINFWTCVFRFIKYDLDSFATKPSVFDDPTNLDIYRPPSSYENAHRFDSYARWTWREEKVDFLPAMHVDVGSQPESSSED